MATAATVDDVAPAAPAPPRRASQGTARRAYRWMILPAVVLFFIFHTVPVLQGIFYSFTNFAGYGEWEFVGLRNYANLLFDDRIRNAYAFTFQFAIVATLLTNVIGLAIALGLNARIKLRNTLRGIFFTPYVLAVLVVGYIFNYLFANSLPAIGQSLGIGFLETSLLANPDLAWLTIVILAVWQATAFATVLYLAGLQTVPADVYEAAAIDGATPWQRFRSITFPLIAPFFTINMVLALKGMMQVFDHVIALTNGGPGTATEPITLLIYRGGFQGGEFAYQTANAVVYFVIIVAVSLVQLRILRSREVGL
jgi:raffinose/stachyose/melibiose transport system permease protein